VIFSKPEKSQYTIFCYRSSFSRLTLRVFTCAHYNSIFEAICGEKTGSLPFEAILLPKDESRQEDDLQSSINEDIEQPVTDNDENTFQSDGSTLFIRLTPEKLSYRLKKIDRDAHSLEEESGLNLLFLAMGFLRWRESSSSKMDLEAPLILVPVDLIGNRKKSTYSLKFREEEMTVNLPLQESVTGYGKKFWKGKGGVSIVSGVRIGTIGENRKFLV